MSSGIHKTAIVSDNASIGKNVSIGAYAIIEDDVVIGDNTSIGEYSIIKKYTTMGENNIIHHHTSIGNLPQDISFDRDKITFLKIGNNNEFREFSSIHRASKENESTNIANNCYVMATGHIAHDCQVLDNVIVCNSALLAGHGHIGRNAFISGNSSIHQFVHIGAFAMIGGNTGVAQDILPFSVTTYGGKAAVGKINIIGMRRAGFTPEEIKEAELAHSMWYNWNSTKVDFLEKYLNDDSLSPVVKEVVEFISNSTRGITAKIK